MKHQRGFSLLEAIVAMAIIASVGMALLAWTHNNLGLLTRISERQEAMQATRQAIAWLETVNIVRKPEGEQVIGHLTIQWQSQPVEAERDGRNIFGVGVTPFRLGLYRTTVRVRDASGRELTQFDVRLAGYQQVRTLTDGLF